MQIYMLKIGKTNCGFLVETNSINQQITVFAVGCLSESKKFFREKRKDNKKREKDSPGSIGEKPFEIYEISFLISST